MVSEKHNFSSWLRRELATLNADINAGEVKNPSSLFRNGPTPASFCLFSFFSNTNFTEKDEGVSGIRTRIVGVEDKSADHLTTTTAQSLLSLNANFYKIWCRIQSIASTFCGVEPTTSKWQVLSIDLCD